MLHFCPLHLTHVLRATRVRSSNRSIVPFYSVHCLRVRAEYTNQHLRNCLMDVVPGTTDSAVAKRATSEDVRTVFIMYLTIKQLTVHLYVMAFEFQPAHERLTCLPVSFGR